MYRVPEYYKTFSQKLSNVLDDIGINERTMLYCRRDALMKHIFNQFSDKHINIVGSKTKWNPKKVNVLMIYEDEDPPGYCRLQPLKSLTKKETPYIYDDKRRVFIENERPQVHSTRRLGHGPAKSDKQKDAERTLMFHYSNMPIPPRSVNYNKKKEISNFEHSECFLEPVGHILSENESFQWRFDVSPAEQQMMFSLNITQIRCYVLLICIVKTCIGSSMEGEVSNYMCKQVLMHMIEGTHYELWTEINLLLCLTLCLRLLQMSVLMNNLPNYFMPEVNMIEGKFNIISRMKLVRQIQLLTDDAVETVLGIRPDNIGRRLWSKLSQTIFYVMTEKSTEDKQICYPLKPSVDMKSKTDGSTCHIETSTKLHPFCDVLFLGKEKNQTFCRLKDNEHLWSACIELRYLLLAGCERICTFIKNKSDSILYVWPAYDSEKGKVVFVVVATEDVMVDVDYRTYIRIEDHYSEEGKRVMQSRKNAENRLSASQSEEIRNVIDLYADTLMQNHRYISVITGSGVRSVGFATENEEIIPEACVVVYVLIKGKIPLEEEEIPKTLDGIPVDIREGGFQTTVLTASGYHDNVRMGCQIMSSTNQPMYGTLGGFIEHQEYGLCGITCAHVLINEQDMHDLRGAKKSVVAEVVVYQPDQKKPKHQVGTLREVAYKAGGGDLPGIDLAVFQIDSRPPECGNFPETSNTKTNLLYESGKVSGEKQFNLNDKYVVKFGSTSGITEGRVEFCTTAVKKINFDRQYEIGTNRYTYTLFNQLEIRPSDNELFNEGGDSGALVFKKDVTGSLICIGMVVGAYSNGNGIVTPISAITRELGVSKFKNFTENKVDRLERQMQRVEKYMKKIAKKLDVDLTKD